MNQEPIFLLGAHKSGTSLLRSIFDGHSQLFTIPIETHYFENVHYWVDYEYRRSRPRKIKRDTIIENLCSWIHLSNTKESQFTDSVTKGLFDEEKFREYISSISAEDGDKERIEKYFEAICYSLNGKKVADNIRIVEKSVENAEFALELLQMFPQARFIHIVRNPYANIVSLRKFKMPGFGFPLMPRIIRSLYNSFYHLYRNRRLIRNYFIIRYEDLVVSPEVQINKMCEFLELPFQDILLTPTLMGKTWEGNSTTGQVYRGFVSKNLDRWKSEILPMEAEYINKLFPFVLKDYQYGSFRSGGSFWKRCKGEPLKRYFYNRLYKFYL